MSERLYHRLPEVIRRRDHEVGEPLRALLLLLEGELVAVERDVAGLYESWFLETCPPWAVPYLAQLLGVSVLGDPAYAEASPRTQLARAVAYRQRKGTAAVLERLAREVVGWPARAVEYYRHLAHTQNPTLLRFDQGRLFDLRRPGDASLQGGPFEPPERFRSVDVRRITSGRGRYNVPNLGLFLWRLKVNPLTATARRLTSGSGRYTFDTLGRDVALFNPAPPLPANGERQAAEHQLPVALRPAALAADLGLYYGSDLAFAVEADGALVPLSAIVVSDLGAWAAPPAGKVAVDPLLGRILFAADRLPAAVDSVRGRYAYAAAADLGGGPYPRAATLSDLASAPFTATVSKAGAVTTLQQAISLWQADGRRDGVIRVADAESYGGSLAVALPAGGRLAIEAADGVRPTLNLVGAFAVSASDRGATLTLNGLRLAGAIELTGSLTLRLLHTTLVPGSGDSLRAGAGGVGELAVEIECSIVGAIRLPAGIVGLLARDSVLDGNGRRALAASDADDPPGPASQLERVTVLGGAALDALPLATEVLFAASVVVRHRAEGCVRYSAAPAGSQLPPCFRCQPDLALVREAEALGLASLPDPSPDRARVLAALTPRWTSTRYGDPGYAQLAAGSHPGLAEGAEDGGEMGALHSLAEPLRRRQLAELVAEYGRFGLEVGSFFVT